jgi:hypothetical protein
MPAQIEVSRIQEGAFRVTVVEGTTRSKHTVTLKDSDYARLSGGRIGAKTLIAQSFEFLLEHEPKESILPRFDLLEIARYFPSFERDLKQRLGTR